MAQRTVESNHAEIVTLRDLLDERTAALQAAIDANQKLEVERHEAINAKLDAAGMVLEHRLEWLNDLRGDVITKGECKATSAELSSKVASLREWKAELGGKASALSVIGAYVLAIASLLVGIAGIIIKLVK